MQENRQFLIAFFLHFTAAIYIYTLSTFVFAAFFSLVTPFVNVWVGKENVFPIFLTWLISINLWLTLIRTPSWMFADSFGLQWVQKWKAVVEAIVNLGLSLLFLKVFKMGIEGIILGTILSTILIVIWYEPWTVFKYVIPKLNLFKYFLFCLPFVFMVFLETVIYFVGVDTIKVHGIFFSILFALAQISILMCVYYSIFNKNKYFHSMINRIVKLLKKMV